MAHGERSASLSNSIKEYWKSRLHRWGETRGRFTKSLTHKKERKINKMIAKQNEG